MLEGQGRLIANCANPGWRLRTGSTVLNGSEECVMDLHEQDVSIFRTFGILKNVDFLGSNEYSNPWRCGFVYGHTNLTYHGENN